MMVFAWIQHCVFVWTCRRSTHIHKKGLFSHISVPLLQHESNTALSHTQQRANIDFWVNTCLDSKSAKINKHTQRYTHTHTHTAVCQERRMMRRLNKHSHQLMGAWVIEKASKWDKEWRHKRERREGERYGDEGAMSRLWWWRVRATGEIRSKSDKGNKL